MDTDDLRLCLFAAEMPAKPDWSITAAWCDLHPDMSVDLIAYTVDRMLEDSRAEPPIPPEVRARLVAAWERIRSKRPDQAA